MKLFLEPAVSASLWLSLIVVGSALGAPSTSSRGSAPEYLHLETSQGVIDCALTGDKAVIQHLKQHVRARTYDDSVLCRAVKDYFIQFGCAREPATRTDGNGDSRVRLPLTGTHEQPGTLAFAPYDKDQVGSQFIITTIKSPWLDGVQPVLGQCKPLALVKGLSAQPTLARAVPRRPTWVIRATIDRVDSRPGRNGLAK
jgi:cyclophilin family peptidyl-prolyl cis-trans isomerase